MNLEMSQIENKIYTIRGIQIMLDSDLAWLYQTETKYINRAIIRNQNRFPIEFAFQLTEDEWDALRCQFGTLKHKAGTGQHRKYLPIVFTEQGVSMMSALLNSDSAIEVSIQIMKAFVAMRKTLGQLHSVIQRLESVEFNQLQSDNKLEQVLKALEKESKPQQGIFFEEQLFDAHVFVSQLIKQANESLTLIDNYINETTLLLLSKRNPTVNCNIYTRSNAALKKDIEKHNLQYPIIDINENRTSHDRFLIIDNIQLYHIGASIKDLGNKCFAFSRMDQLLTDVQSKLLKR